MIHAREALLRKIKFDFEKNRFSTITCDGIEVDADELAVNNITGKLLGIQAKETLQIPISNEELFWKDTNGLLHTWTDVSAFKEWLLKLTTLISDRTTSLYAAYWNLKSQVQLLDTPQQVQEFLEGL
jgi:hypothetical protein